MLLFVIVAKTGRTPAGTANASPVLNAGVGLRKLVSVFAMSLRAWVKLPLAPLQALSTFLRASGLANTTHPFSHPGISTRLGVFVPLWAMGFLGIRGRDRLPSEGIYLAGDRFEVIGIDAPSMKARISPRTRFARVVAKMVNRKAFWNGTVPSLISKAVGLSVLFGKVGYSIPVLVNVSGPRPTLSHGYMVPQVIVI